MDGEESAVAIEDPVGPDTPVGAASLCRGALKRSLTREQALPGSNGHYRAARVAVSLPSCAARSAGSPPRKPLAAGAPVKRRTPTSSPP